LLWVVASVVSWGFIDNLLVDTEGCGGVPTILVAGSKQLPSRIEKQNSKSVFSREPARCQVGATYRSYHRECEKYVKV